MEGRPREGGAGGAAGDRARKTPANRAPGTGARGAQRAPPGARKRGSGATPQNSVTMGPAANREREGAGMDARNAPERRVRVTSLRGGAFDRA